VFLAWLSSAAGGAMFDTANTVEPSLTRYRSGCGRGYDNSAYVEASPQQKTRNVLKALRSGDGLTAHASRRSPSPRRCRRSAT